jgi:arginyl-tRNA synthetase
MPTARARIRNAINDLTFKGHVYKGKLPPPKGQSPEDWEDREQTLFRSTEVGDDIDRPLIKSDGSYTYFAADVAYFRDKFERGFTEMIYVLGADHGGYIKRLEAVARAVSAGDAKLTVLLCQLVKIYRNGEPVRMSKRSGDFVTLRDVVDEVGVDSVRFMMLYRKSSESLDFRLCQGDRAVQGQSGFLCSIRPRTLRLGDATGARTFPDLDISPRRLARRICPISNSRERSGSDRKAWRIPADA